MRLSRLPGVGTVRVPVDHAAPGGPWLELAYAEAGRRPGAPTVVLLPGGPGLASVVPYAVARRRLAARGLHVVMPEHRGVGLSRRLAGGELVPRELVTIEQAARDALAVRDAVGGERAILAGSSYGGYLALEVVRRAAGRFEALVLDSSGASVRHPERDRQRACFWDGTEPGFARVGARVRALVESGTLGDDAAAMAVPLAYELAGMDTLEALLGRAERGHVRALRRLHRIGAEELAGGRRALVFDGDLTLPVALGRMTPERPDGRPFDRSRALEPVRAANPGIVDDPFDATSWLAETDLPTLVLEGARDMRTPPAAVDELLAGLPRARRIRFPHAGHDLVLTRTGACARILAGLATGGLDAAERAAADVAGRRPRWEPWAARLAALAP